VFDLFEKMRSLDAVQIAYLSITHVQDINNNNLLALGVGKLGTIQSKITSDLSTGLKSLFKIQITGQDSLQKFLE
jgi:hypothetical protein